MVGCILPIFNVEFVYIHLVHLYFMKLFCNINIIAIKLVNLLRIHGMHHQPPTHMYNVVHSSHQFKSNQVYLYTALFENDSVVFTVQTNQFMLKPKFRKYNYLHH